MWLLEQALSDVSHDLLVFSDFGGDTDQCAQFWRQINVLSLLSDFKEWLSGGMNFNMICSVKIINHVGTSFFISMVENVILWVHVPFDLVDFVSSVRAIFGHDNSTFKFSANKVLIKSLKSIFY